MIEKYYLSYIYAIIYYHNVISSYVKRMSRYLSLSLTQIYRTSKDNVELIDSTVC